MSGFPSMSYMCDYSMTELHKIDLPLPILAKCL